MALKYSYQKPLSHAITVCQASQTWRNKCPIIYFKYTLHTHKHTHIQCGSTMVKPFLSADLHLLFSYSEKNLIKNPCCNSNCILPAVISHNLNTVYVWNKLLFPELPHNNLRKESSWKEEGSCSKVPTSQPMFNLFFFF